LDNKVFDMDIYLQSFLLLGMFRWCDLAVEFYYLNSSIFVLDVTSTYHQLSAPAHPSYC